MNAEGSLNIYLLIVTFVNLQGVRGAVWDHRFVRNIQQFEKCWRELRLLSLMVYIKIDPKFSENIRKE